MAITHKLKRRRRCQGVSAVAAAGAAGAAGAAAATGIAAAEPAFATFLRGGAGTPPVERALRLQRPRARSTGTLPFAGAHTRRGEPQRAAIAVAAVAAAAAAAAAATTVGAAAGERRPGGAQQVKGKAAANFVMTDFVAKSFLKVFNNAFLNTIERVRTPHLVHVIRNLREFAARVPPKYRTNIEKALGTDGFLNFLLSRAALSLLCAKATLPPAVGGGPPPVLAKEHEDLATVVEELYIAAMLHAEEQWDRELRADGKSFMAVATSFVKHLLDPEPLKAANIQEALLGFDANPMTWTQYGLDMIGISFDASIKATFMASSSSSSTARVDKRKVSLLGGDSLYATAQWAMANLDSRACRKLIAKTIAMYSDGQLRKREELWNLDLTVRQYLEMEKTAGVAAFFGASAACPALLNGVGDEIAQQLADFGSDIGLVVAVLKDMLELGIRSSLKLGRISAPVIFAMENDPELRALLERRLAHAGDYEEAVRRVRESGILPTVTLLNRLGYRASARLECLEPGEEKDALLTLTRGIACLPLAESAELFQVTQTAPLVGIASVQDFLDYLLHPHAETAKQDSTAEAVLDSEVSKRFQLKVENLRLRAGMQRLRYAERRAREVVETIREVANGGLNYRYGGSRPSKAPMIGLGLQFDSQEIDWLLLKGLERRVPLPVNLNLESLLSCVAKDQADVERRLLAVGDAADSTKLKRAVKEVFSAGGKRLRPALCLLVHQMLQTVLGIGSVGASGSGDTAAKVRERKDAAHEKVMLLATAIEVIHTASLVHDDILDDADTRRQQQAMHQIFGPDVAVLSGDFLFAHASGLIESLEDDECTRLVSLVIEEFGYGELSQSAKRFNIESDIFDYLKKSFYKTASLLAAACRASSVLTGATSRVSDVMYSYGFYLGVAFQIADDVLDFEATDDELGKPAWQDLCEGNLTAPVILCLQGNEDLCLEPSRGAKELARLINGRFVHKGDLERAVAIIREDGGTAAALRLADKMAAKALEALMLVAPNDSEARRALAGLTRWAVQRST